MELELDNGHPLAAAIRTSVTGGNEVFLTLKSSGNSYYRAVVSQWSVAENTTRVMFETWEEYMERKALLAGL